MDAATVAVFTGNANPQLAHDIAKHLQMPLGRASVGRFSDGEVTAWWRRRARPPAFSSSTTCWYCDGWVRIPTSRKFLAAARIMAGPPMSISSSARLAPCSKLSRLGAERVEVRHHEVDRLDAVLGHVLLVVGVAAVGEDPAVHLRVQRDHPVAEDRRRSR